MRKLAIVALAFSLAGCQTVIEGLKTAAGFEVTQEQVDAAKSGYAVGVLVWASGYRSLYDINPCGSGQHATVTNICAEYPVVIKLQDTHKIIDQSLRDAQAGVAACKINQAATACRGLPAAYQTLIRAIEDAKAVAKVYGYAGK